MHCCANITLIVYMRSQRDEPPLKAISAQFIAIEWSAQHPKTLAIAQVYYYYHCCKHAVVAQNLKHTQTQICVYIMCNVMAGALWLWPASASLQALLRARLGNTIHLVPRLSLFLDLSPIP